MAAEFFLSPIITLRSNHIGFKNASDFRRPFGNRHVADNIARQGHELVGTARHIDLQSDFAVVDVVFLFVVVERTCLENDTHAFTRRTVLGVAVHRIDDIERHLAELSVFDTMVDINGRVAVEYADADAVVFLRQAHRFFKAAEVAAFGSACAVAVSLVRHLCHIALALLSAPYAEQAVLFQLLGDITVRRHGYTPHHAARRAGFPDSPAAGRG